MSAPSATKDCPGKDEGRQPWRLRKHADYQRVYKSSRKQQSTSMTFFASSRTSEGVGSSVPSCARVGLTAGKVLGNAVVRNRIKRRMRAAVRSHVHLLPVQADVILHPRKQVLAVPFSELSSEVEKIFSIVAKRFGPAQRSAASVDNPVAIV